MKENMFSREIEFITALQTDGLKSNLKIFEVCIAVLDYKLNYVEKMLKSYCRFYGGFLRQPSNKSESLVQ